MNDYTFYYVNFYLVSFSILPLIFYNNLLLLCFISVFFFNFFEYYKHSYFGVSLDFCTIFFLTWVFIKTYLLIIAHSFGLPCKLCNSVGEKLSSVGSCICFNYEDVPTVTSAVSKG